MKRYLALLFLACTACTSQKITITPADSILAKVEGTWGTAEASSLSCGQTPQTYTVSKDGTTITVRSANKLYIGGDEGRESFVYKVRAVHGNVLTMFIENEDRKTKNGDPVVWSLVLVNENEFYWRQTDWPEGSRTSSFVRCG